MQAREKPFGVDQEITLARRSAATTIRKEHQKGKVVLRKDTLGWAADVEQDDGISVTFGISESDFKALGSRNG